MMSSEFALRPLVLTHDIGGYVWTRSVYDKHVAIRCIATTYCERKFVDLIRKILGGRTVPQGQLLDELYKNKGYTPDGFSTEMIGFIPWNILYGICLPSEDLLIFVTATMAAAGEDYLKC
jgi:hypothetical protein